MAHPTNLWFSLCTKLQRFLLGIPLNLPCHCHLTTHHQTFVLAISTCALCSQLRISHCQKHPNLLFCCLYNQQWQWKSQHCCCHHLPQQQRHSHSMQFPIKPSTCDEWSCEVACICMPFSIVLNLWICHWYVSLEFKQVKGTSFESCCPCQSCFSFCWTWWMHAQHACSGGCAALLIFSGKREHQLSLSFEPDKWNGPWWSCHIRMVHSCFTK